VNIRRLIKILLFIFLAFSFAFLIYKEYSPESEGNTTNISEKKGEKTSVSGKSMPVQEKQPAREATGQYQEKESLHLPEAKMQTLKVVAYYFHGTYRCITCRTIERYSKEAIERYFAQELKNGTLEFKPINVEEPENRHYIQDYQLFTRSLVLVRYKDDEQQEWKNLSEVWSYVRDKDKFYQYVKEETKKFLQG
jgi:hypothetical protein